MQCTKGKYMKKIKLTKDPLTNINLMVPMLNDRTREAVSYFIYGCCVGESISKEIKETGEKNIDTDKK